MDMPQRLNMWLAECRQPSTAYKFACLSLVLIHIITGFFVIGYFFDGLPRDNALLIVRLLLEALAMVTVCHVFMRPFLRLGILRTGLSGASFSALVLYCLPVAALMSALMFTIANISDFSNFDINSVQFTSKSGEVSGHATSQSAYIIIAGQQYAFLLFWAALYLSWHFYHKRNELSRELEVARLQQLANQINPHFLFNTLNSIRALVYTDKDKAAETITQLSELMRVHMHAEVQTLSAFEQERQLAQSYLDIELLRMQDRLSLNWHIAPGIAVIKIPSLVLLTLLENAVKYGIAPSSCQGFIKVEAEMLAADRWRLTVINSLPKQTVAKGHGIGLSNISKRLTLLYGDRASLSISQSETFRVTIEMPVI